ncbi:MAG: hypothetical protein E7604_12455 [Ruminococcaceae bacterium]|nr:hypothetical protein [Oscillospiraceae bacterium]
MKIWTTPIARGQKFAANDYVSACYKMSCCAWPAWINGEGDGTLTYISNLYDDTNGNGQWDGKDVDKRIISGVATCGAEMENHVVGDPNKPNSFIEINGEVIPAYFWEDSNGDGHVGQLGKTTVDLGNMS